MINPPPSPFPAVTCKVLPAGTELHRVHNRRFGPLDFNPGLGAPTRFAPLIDGSDTVATAYAAENLTCAIFETILHDVVPNAAATVSWSHIEPLDHSHLKLKKPLRLAQLFAPDLSALGLTRGQLIDTPPSEYPHTAAWAYALQKANHHVAGLIWTSRACDPHWATILFGHRFSSLHDHFELVEQTPIGDCDDRLNEVRLACLRIKASIAF